MDAIDRFGAQLVLAGTRPAGSRRGGRRAGIVLVAAALVLACTGITLAATGVILTGSPVSTIARPVATAGEGIPAPGGTTLLPLRAPDPAGGLPWGMRLVHTTRGLVCVQIGRVYRGQLGQLGIDGAYGNDGRFHPLPASALPEVLGPGGWMTGSCANPGDTFAGDSVGLSASAQSALGTGRGVPARTTSATPATREISFGLLGAHAVSISYRDGPETRTQRVLPSVGAYLIAQRYSSGRPLGSVSETAGRDEPGNYSQPASPNGALTQITYRYGGRTCVDNGALRDSACGLSEVPAPAPAPLPAAQPALSAVLHVSHHLITDAQIRFRAPYAVTGAGQSYSVSAELCHGYAGTGTRADIRPGEAVSIPVAPLLSEACGRRAVTFKVEYVRNVAGLPRPTPLGSITIHEPTGSRAMPVPARVAEAQRRAFPEHSLHLPVHLTLLPQPRKACDAAFLLYPCYRGQVAFVAPYTADSPAAEYAIRGFAHCTAGGRPGETWSPQQNVRAGTPVRSVSLGLFVVTPSCAAREGFQVLYLNRLAPPAPGPHESVIVGEASLREARSGG